jgi:DNA-binding XRE family transcriptional regulator
MKKPHDNVREARKRLSLTQIEFAAALGVSEKTIARYENGHKVPSRTLMAIKHLLEQKEKADG